MDITNELSSFFKAKELKQDTIADSLGVSQQYVSMLLTGRKPFGKKQANRFSELYGLSASWLLTGEGPMLVSDKQDDPDEVSRLRERIAHLEALLEEKERLIQVLLKK